MMIRPTILLASGLAFAGTAAEGAGRTGVSHKDCEVIRILEDGREVRSTGSARSRASVDRGSGTASGSAAVSSRGRAGSSSSASSSSYSSASSSGSGAARATSSYTDENGRTVTTVHDGRACRITIDEREISGEE